MKVYRNPLLKMQQSLWSLLLGGGSTQDTPLKTLKLVFSVDFFLRIRGTHGSHHYEFHQRLVGLP